MVPVLDVKQAQRSSHGSALSGQDGGAAGRRRLEGLPDPLATRDAREALAATRGQLGKVCRENDTLKLKNEQLLRKLVNVSRRALAANHMAHHDPLTGLPNRLLLIKRLQRVIAEAARQQQLLALLFIDLDGFKTVNDRCGHEIGDRLLAVVAARIAACVRADDIACRYGGDEFVALLANIDDPAIAVRISQDIQEVVGRRYWIDGQAINITASIGVAIYPADGVRYDALLSHADAEMYRCKAARRTGCVMSSSSAAVKTEIPGR